MGSSIEVARADTVADAGAADGFAIEREGGETVDVEVEFASELAQDFDVVMSDLGLPDGSGYEVMEALRDKTKAFGIALSGYGMDADIHRSTVAGFRLHLTKPVDAQKLYEAVERGCADDPVEGM